jgi:hypothetical protein
MKYYSVTEYDPEGGFEPVIYVDGQGPSKGWIRTCFGRACRAISYEVYEVIALILSELPRATVWLRGGEIKATFPNPADNM